MAVARAGSFSLAANDIAITPSALSHGIHELEQRLGKKLILRKKTGTFLTSYGKALYNDIAPLYDKSINIFNRTKGDTPRTVICVDAFLNPTLPKKLAILIEKFGNRIEIKSSKASLPLENTLDEYCDVILDVTYGLNEKIPTSVYKMALPPEKIVIVASEKVISKYKDPFQMLKMENIFLRDAVLQHNVFQKIKNNLREHCIKGQFIALPDVYDVIGALTLDMGIALITENAVNHPAFNEKDLISLDMPKEFQFILNRGIYFKKERYDELIDIVSCIHNN
ncbi:LysR family transcriptional regulator [Enterobacterales bacterium BIT-L3]|uniref:LysR family transcriptional regulator n=2 Tax=Tenebrionibacter/Tenebrionicola group TaxID=2969848 RepID=A0A8K0V1E1_9ENTR|nr:LysR family transcriptional regulator [Tenebrionibacter intestinalis]MBV5096427.1 LysR family transcriptional regulator [Tenebrionicola larvae]